MSKIVGTVLRKIRIANINALVTWPIIIGMVILIGPLALAQKVMGEDVPDLYIAISGIISVLIFSFSGLFQVIRQEAPGVPGVLGGTTKGIWPVITGLLWLFATWGMALYLLYHLIF